MAKISMILLLLLLLLIATTKQQQQQKKNICNRKLVDDCMADLIIIGDRKRRFPHDLNSMIERCNRMKKSELCVKNYSKNCLSNESKNTVSVLMFGISRTNKIYCKNNKRKADYLTVGNCANKIVDETFVRMNDMVKAYHAIKHYKDVNLRIPLVCCNYFKFKTSILKLAQDKCNIYNQVEFLLDGYANDVINLICGDYTDESDKCDHIIDKTPEWKHGNALNYTTFVIPLAEIVGNLE